MKKLIYGLMGLAFMGVMSLVSIGVTAVQAEPRVTITFAHCCPAEHTYGVYAHMFADLVAENSNGDDDNDPFDCKNRKSCEYTCTRNRDTPTLSDAEPDTRTGVPDTVDHAAHRLGGRAADVLARLDGRIPGVGR